MLLDLVSCPKGWPHSDHLWSPFRLVGMRVFLPNSPIPKKFAHFFHKVPRLNELTCMRSWAALSFDTSSTFQRIVTSRPDALQNASIVSLNVECVAGAARGWFLAES